MAKLAVDRFLQLVELSGLIPPDRVASLVAQWKKQATAAQLDDAEHCGRFLVQSGALTRWQCHKLLDGRHRGFRLGNYQLLDHLGSGGMSNVYLAEHLLMQRRVAIKVLPEHLVADSSYLARFHFEGQAVASLDHPNIVRAYDLGSEGRIHYLVMEYVEGSDLEELIERRGPLPYHLAASYAAQAALGLEHAHEAGMVHRDIKPANLLVDRHGTVRILDLGLARFRAEVKPAPEFARDEQVLGTAAYFAPEQAVNSQTVDGRADIYGLGCTLYYLLTGHPPFQGQTPLELKVAHHNEVAPSVLVDRPDAPPELLAICAKMMEKQPENRFQSAGEAARSLRRWLETERSAGRLTDGVKIPHAEPAKYADQTSSDTLLDLGDTAEINRRDFSRSSDVFAPLDLSSTPSGGSDVVVPPPPPLPPVVPPPRHSHDDRTSGSLPRARAVDSATSNARSHEIAPLNIDAVSAAPRVRARRASNVTFWVSLVIAALILVIAILGLVAARS